ncbi:MAG: polyprenyl synthetase family protein [Tepidanaerobacteraceae bacterium]
METIKSFGQKIGLIFQIVDDILDIKCDENILGKNKGSDLKNKKNTFPYLLGYDNSIKLVKELSIEAKNLVSKYKNNDFFIQLTDFISKRDY